MIVQTGRRGFITGLISLIAAPAVVRAASLMPVSAPKLIMPPPVVCGGNTLLTIDMITREAIQIFQRSNAFLRNLDKRDDIKFYKGEQWKIDDTLRVRLPSYYCVAEPSPAALSVPLPVAAALGAATVIAANLLVSRRFWGS